MQASVPPEVPFVQQSTGQTSVLCPQFCAEVAQSADMPSGRAKKRERDEKNLDSNKRERLDKSIKNSSVRDNVWKADLSNIVGRDGGLFNFACVDKLICLMQHAQSDGVKKRIDVLLERTTLINIILATQQVDCLNKFVKVGGLLLLDEWLQDALKGTPGDSESPTEGERVSEDVVLILLRTLETLPVDMVALQTCSVGKSVNSLRNHRHVEIQKRARKVVDMWKKRVETEIKQSGELNVVLNHEMNPTEQNLPLQLKKDGVFDVAVKGAVRVKSASQVPNSAKFVAPGELSCAGVKNFASVASLCSSALCNNPSKSPTTSLSDLESSSFDAIVKSTNTGPSDSDGKGGSSPTVCHEENVEGSGSCVRDGKVSAGACKRARVQNTALSWCRNVALDIYEHNAHGAGSGNSTRAQNDNLDNLVPDLRQDSLLAICRSSSTGEMHTPSSGSLSPSMSEDDRAHLDSGDPTDGRNTDIGPAAFRPKGKTQNSCSAPPHPKPIDTVTSEVKNEGYVIDDCKPRICQPTTVGVAASNKNELKESDVLTTSCAFSSVSFAEKVESTSDIPNAGINLLASVAASECSVVEKKIDTSLLEERFSMYGALQLNNENSLCLKTSPIQQGRISDRQMPTGGLFTEREQFDRTSSTMSSPHAFSREGVRCSNECLSTKAPTPADTASSDGRFCISDSVEPTSDLLKSSTDDPSQKPSLKYFSSNQADCEELYGLQPASGKPDTQFAAKSVLIAEAKVKSSIAGLVVADAMKENEDAKLLETERVQNRMGTISFRTESNLISRILGDYARERERQFSAEIELERVKSVGNSCDTENSERSQNSELQSRTFMSADYVEMEENCSRHPPLGTLVGTNFQPKTVELNLHYTLDDKADIAKPRRFDQSNSVSCRADLEGGDAMVTGAGENPGLRCSDPASLLAVFPSVLTEDEAAVRTTAPPQKDLQQVSYTIGKAVLNTLEQSMLLSSPEINGIKRNDRLQRLELDLNEGLSCEDGLLQDCVSSLSLPCAKQSAILSDTGPTAPIAIVAATKGPFIPPANPFRLTGELGWKGSAATSAFRPAQPRRNAEKRNGTSQTTVVNDCPNLKVDKPALNFDLNVAADKGCEDAGYVSNAEITSKPRLQGTCLASSQPSIAQAVIVEDGLCVLDSNNKKERGGRPIWDLNRANEDDEEEAILASQGRSGVECLRSFKDCKSIVLDFDLNDGPVSHNQDTLVPSSGSGNDFKIPASTGSGNDFGIPEASTSVTMVMTSAAREGSGAPGKKASLLENSESPYSIGSKQSLVCTGIRDGSYHLDIYRRGHPFPSTAVTFPSPLPTDYSFTGFPFGFTPGSFCSLSASFVDPSEAQPFPILPPAMLSSEAVVSSKIRPPYLMGPMVPTGDSIWERPSLDLNSGPELGIADAKDDRSSCKMFPAMAGAGAHKRMINESIGVVDHLKKKETNRCWGFQRAVVEQQTQMWQ